MLLTVPLFTVYSYVYKFSIFLSSLNSIIWMNRISKLLFVILVRDLSYDTKLRETANLIFIV